jgi:hypothetical protein
VIASIEEDVMTPQNGTTATPWQTDGLDALAANFRTISEYLRRSPPAAPSARGPQPGRLRAAMRAIEDHPLAAAAVAFGLGYVASRLARR